MTDLEKEAPAAANSQGDQSINRPSLVSVNNHPRQRWRGNPSMTVPAMSPELRSFFLIMGGTQ